MNAVLEQLLPLASSALPTAGLLARYRSMLRIRRTEEAIAERYNQWRMRCPVHLCIGQEAIAAGVCGELRRDDVVFSNHRSHGHYLAKGGDLNALIAELYGKAAGCAGGRGGSMHLQDLAAGFAGATPIVGGTLPLAVGAAWAAKLKGSDRVAAVFFGDGCFEEGVLHESMNFAVLHRLPVVFVCENNSYSVYTGLAERQPPRPIHAIAAAHGLGVIAGDGNDVEAVAQTARAVIGLARSGDGPQFLEYATHRWLEHCGPGDDDCLGYRQPGELAQWRNRCPLESVAVKLRSLGVAAGVLEQLEQEVGAEVAAAFRFAEAGPPPEPASLGHGVYAPAGPGVTTVAASEASKSRCITYSQAILEALQGALERDPATLLIGEGVPDPKGIFGTTEGLRQRFGERRVFDSPLSENGVTGICIGAALSGMRPIMTHQRIDFALLAMDQLVNNAAKWRYMFANRQGVPLVVRVIVGRGWGQGPQHGQSLQALFGHIPGLKVVMPVTPADAKGMLTAAAEGEDPVLFIEHRWLHHLQGMVPSGRHSEPLEGARVRRAGNDITIAAYSHMVIEALRAAEWLAEQGVSTEVIDMRCVTPADTATVAASVRRTGRLLVADTGFRKGGVAASLVSDIAVEAFDALRKPPVIVALPDHPVPTSRFLADDYYPDAATVAGYAVSLCDRGIAWETTHQALRRPGPRDQPDRNFVGPF